MSDQTTSLVPRLRAVDHMSVEDCFLQSHLFAQAADEIERLRAALRVIAGEAPCADNLLGNADIARIALHGR